jgi:catechol 2,3-dioxygenase-like lactoylglutathione lyase family enzyme
MAEQPHHELRPTRPTWTHLALHVKDIDEMIAWYEDFTHLRMLFRDEDEDGYGAWLGDSTTADHPFILVLGQFFEGHDPFAPLDHPPLGPFAHIGIEVPEKQMIDDVAAKAKGAGCLILGPKQMAERIGYICFVRDPEGNIVEFSYDQGVYEKAREVWGKGTA